MFKAIKDNKIIAVNDIGEFPCLVYDSIEEDTEHQLSDYRHYAGEFTLLNIEKENEQAKLNRANAYTQEVDPLMNEFTRKKTFNLFEEGEEESLQEEINKKVAEIKARYPYIEE